MKILFSHYGYKDGGGFSRSYQLAKEMVKLGHEVTFITCQYKKFKFPYHKESRDDLELISFPEIVPINMIRTGFGLLSILLKIIYVIFHKYDIVHSDTGHRPSAGIPCKVHRVFHKSKYISEWWDHFGKEGQYITRSPFQRLIIGNYDRIFEVLNKKKADGVVALSNFTHQRAIEAGIPKGKISIINGGADINTIPYIESNSYKRKYTNSNDLVLGFIGINSLELKDIMPLLEALSELELPIKLITTGGKISSKFLINNNLCNKIIELGWLDYLDFAKAITEVDVFVMLQKENLQNKARWPNKIGDYIAAGRPTLVNIWGEIEFYKKHSFLFYFVDWKKDSIIKKLTELYNNKDDISKNNSLIRKFAEETLSWKCQAEKLADFYIKCLN
jgi:glycosyltransferase involved in cell wall biosynthesis